MKNVTYINAGAGSGKTYRLTKTLTELIKEKKVKPEQVILTTFTIKAANEFKEKAKAFLFDEGMYEEAVQLDHAMIGTVHSVCQRMIGKYWFNLGLSPDMGVMAENDTDYYISQSLADLPTREELKVLHAFAREFDCRGIGDNGFISRNFDYNIWQGHLKKIIDFATNYEIDDFTESEKKSLEFIKQFVLADLNTNVSDEELSTMLEEARTYVENNNRIKKKDSYYEKFNDIERRAGNKCLAWYNSINDSLKSNYGDTCAAVLERLAHIYESQYVYAKQEPYIRLLFDLAKRWKENFAQFKREKNLLDFNDMEKYMRLLLQNEDIASEISESYRYLFVDEFQDSSPIQVKIFDALSNLMEHSYWVGDYKQAIYGFRGTDVPLVKAVVDRISTQKNGCDTDLLDKSWRSLPDIVDLNNAVYGQTFNGILARKNIRLDSVRTNDNNETSLRYFVSSNEIGVAEHVLKLLREGAQPNEIAVLARTNAELGKVASDLQVWNIPASRGDIQIIESKEYSLVKALLHIVESASDAFSKATVAFLTEQDYDTRQIIESKILYDVDLEAKPESFLADVPMISRLLKIRSRLQQQSVASLVESMIVELGLFEEIAKLNRDPAMGNSCLHSIISAARNYEEHSVNMNMPATIDGFLSYVEVVSPNGVGDPTGVQLCTYHTCKGLQWKYVILMSLNDSKVNDNRVIKDKIYGVNAIYTEEPSAQNPYPDVFIRFTPWIFGAKHSPSQPIGDAIKSLGEFEYAKQSAIAESNRVLYVGMTRPRDVLILNINVPGKNGTLLNWPKINGVTGVATSIPESGDWDVFGTGHMFKDFTIRGEENSQLESYGERDETLGMALKIDEPSFVKREPRYLSPSRVRAKGKVVSHHDFEKRIPFASLPSDMAVVGDCIHQIFAGIEGGEGDIDATVSGYELGGVLTDKNAITAAWNNLVSYLNKTHGAAVKTYHERPFRLERNEQVLTGSIDLVWQTEDGDILIDFKTCPMGPSAVLNAESDHYAGWYAGQLDAYTDALEAGGEKVLKRYIYYPVSGVIAEVSRAE